MAAVVPVSWVKLSRLLPSLYGLGSVIVILFCSFVLCRLPDGTLLLVNSTTVRTALFTLSFSSCFRVDLNPCSFHSCCLCALPQSPVCGMHSAACSASIVVVIPGFGYQALESKLPFESCYRPSRDSRIAPPFPLIVRKGTERGSATSFSIATILFLHRVVWLFHIDDMGRPVFCHLSL